MQKWIVNIIVTINKAACKDEGYPEVKGCCTEIFNDQRTALAAAHDHMAECMFSHMPCECSCDTFTKSVFYMEEGMPCTTTYSVADIYVGPDNIIKDC